MHEILGSVGVELGVSLPLFFVIGLLGGAHCLGMCGPLVTAYADRLERDGSASSWGAVRGHAMFNLGRAASYAAIGGVLGVLGGTAFGAASALELGDLLRGAVGLVVGAFVIVAGLAYLASGTAALARFDGGPASRAVGSLGTVIAARIDRWVRGPRIVALGALHGLLPCPILYPAFLVAFASGDGVGGMLSLLALGLGTVPALFLYGMAFGTLGPGTRRRLHRAMGLAFLGLGYLPLSMGLRLFGVEVPGVHVPIYQPLG